MTANEKFVNVDFRQALKNKKPFVFKFVIKKMLDTDPDLSYLQQDYSADDGGITPEENAKYMQQDSERLERYNAGYWCMYGIRAECEYYLPNDDGSSAIVQTLTSGGLWGIESDSEKSYFEEIGRDELAQLKKHCDQLGIAYDDKTPVVWSDE